MHAWVVGGFQSLWIAGAGKEMGYVDGEWLCGLGIVDRWLLRLVAGESLKRISEARVADSWSSEKSKRVSAIYRRH